MQVEFPIEAPMKDNGIKQNSYMENGKTDSQGVPEKIREENIKVIDDSTGVMAGELELKRPRATDNDGGEVQNVCHILRHSELSAFTRYKTKTNAANVTTGITASCPRPANISNIVKSNLENYSLKKSGSGSKHGSCNVPNRSNTAVNIEGTKVENVGIVEKSGSGGDGDLATDVINTLLHEPFANKYPSVKDAKLVIDSNIGCSKGYGFVRLASFFARLFKMTNFAVKHSIMTREMVENFCNNYYIPDEVHPVAPGRDKTITQFPEGKVGVYTRFFDYCGYRIPFTKNFMAVLRYFRIHISQLSPFGAARVSHFEVLTRVLDLAPSVTVFRAFYTRTYSDGLFSFAKRSTSSPSCFPKPPDSIKNWSDHFFWVDAKVFPIPVSLYVGGVLEKDPAPHLTARQEQTVRLLENNKAHFRSYPECFLCLVGLSPYYPFDENTYPVFERPDGTEMGLLDLIKIADPRKVQAVEVQKKDDQVKLLESTTNCFMSLVTPAVGGSSSAAALEVSAPEVSAPAEVEPENVVPEDTYLDLTEPNEVATTQSVKSKRKRLVKQSDALPAKQLRKDHPSLATGIGGKTLAGLRQLMPTSPLVLRPSFQADIQAHVIVQSARTADVPVYTAAATVTSARENVGVTPTSDVAGSSQLETSEGSDDSFYELPVLNSAEAKRWYVPRWNITNDSLLDDGFSCRTLVDRVAPPGFFSTLRSMYYEQLYTEFNVGAARHICLESEVRSRAEHELELKEKLKGKYDARGRLLEEKNLEIFRLKSLLTEEAEKAEKAETAKVVRLRDQVSALTGEVSALKSTIAQKDTNISLLDSRATYLKSALDDSKAACAEAESLITSLTSERDRLTSKVSTLHTAFQDFKKKAETQQEEQAQVLYNRVVELKAHVMDVSGRIMGHALGRAMDFGMQEGLEAGYEHGISGTQLSAVEAYNPEAARTSYFNAVRALEDVDFPLINLLKSKKDAGMDEVLDCPRNKFSGSTSPEQTPQDADHSRAEQQNYCHLQQEYPRTSKQIVVLSSSFT
ncbi:hypothetical protein Tco_1316778 [Tanacetum coccineum]